MLFIPDLPDPIYFNLLNDQIGRGLRRSDSTNPDESPTHASALETLHRRS